MSNVDLDRAKNLAGLFGPAPTKRAPEKPAEPVLAAVPEPDQATGEGPAETEHAASAVTTAVGVMGKVINIPVAPVPEIEKPEPIAHHVESPVAPLAAPVAPQVVVQPKAPVAVSSLVPSEVVNEITTPMRLKGAVTRQNVYVAQATFDLLRDVDRRLAQSGRPVVSRNALIAAAAKRVIANPQAYVDAGPREDGTATAAIQGRAPEELRVQLRAAAYSTQTPLVTVHAMAKAVEELLLAAKKGVRAKA